MILIPVRHGEAIWNLEGREMGHLDSPLTERGIQQSQALAARLREMGVGAIYSSDLGRAVQTAEIIAAACGLKPQLDSELRERHMGQFQGLTRAEVSERFPGERAEYEKTGFYSVVPEGESARDRLDRSAQVFSRIAEASAEKLVVAVTHGGLLMAFFEYVLGLEPGNGWRFRKRNASYNAFGFDEGRWRLNTWNDTSHLKDLISLDDPAHEHASATSDPLL